MCVALFCCGQVIAGEHQDVYYSGKDVTGGVVIAKDDYEITVRERNGKQRLFVYWWGDLDNSETSVEIDGRSADFKDVKTGMRVQIEFYFLRNGKRLDGITHRLPIISIKARANSSETPKS